MSEYSTNERQCCGHELNTNYNCVENHCSFTLWNASNALSCLNICGKYSEDNDNVSCGTIQCCSIINYLLFPCMLFGDIITCPCRSFLYCEKCVECGNSNSNDTTGNAKDVITTQPI